MSALLNDDKLLEFADRFKQELEFLSQTNPDGLVIGEKITNSVREILLIDLRCSDVSEAMEQLPLDIKLLVADAFRSPSARWGLNPLLEMVDRVRSLVSGHSG